MKNKCKILVILCGIMLLVITSMYSWKAVAEWNRRRIFVDVMAGNFSAVQGLDAEKVHELEYVYKLAEENGRLAWIECDINEDDKKELIMLESLQNGRGSIITGIFMIKGSKCIRILWDVNDYISCYYLVENMVIQYSEDHGLGTQYCYVKYEIDSEGKMTPVKRFETIDISEADDIIPSFIERGFFEPGTYYVVTDYGKDGSNPENETSMDREEWMSEFNREIGDYETVNLENYGAEPDMLFLEKYKETFAEMNGGRTALLYLDDDSVPELLIFKDGEYQLYFFDGFEAERIPLPDAEMKADAYGIRYDLERLDRPEEQIFYWFEYVPRGGLVRVHGGDNGERHDYYLKYEDGLLRVELETDDDGYAWNTYDTEGKIANQEFLDRLAELGYDGLACCEYLYGDVETAYENMGRIPDQRQILEDFVSGKADAMEYVEEQCGIPEEGFVMRSFDDFYEEMTIGEPWWGGLEYADFDNDGEDELIMHGYAGARLYFDVIGDTVYKVLRTGSATDVSYAAEIEGKRVVVRTDLTHGGRKSYTIMTYDKCCCLTDWFQLYVSYEGEDYGAEDSFEYRNHTISMEEFETILNSIHDL